MRPQTMGCGQRADKGQGRALTIGASRVNNRRQSALRVIKLDQQPLNTVERQINQLGMQG